MSVLEPRRWILTLSLRPSPRGSAVGLLTLLLSAALVSCSGGDSKPKKGTKGGSSSEDESTDASIEERLETANALFDKAKAAGLEAGDPEAFERASKQLEDAASLIESGDEAKAKTKLSLASKTLNTFIKDKALVGEAVKKIAAVRKAAETAKKKAETAKAKEHAEETHKQALEAYQSGVAAVDKAASPKAVEDAKRDFEQARVLFEQAAQSAGENATARTRAEAEKKALVELKEKVQKLGAEEKAPQDWFAATQGERDAEALFTEGDFRGAIEAYRAAARGYVQAQTTLQQLAEMAKMQDDAAEREKAYLAQIQADQKAAEGESAEEGAETEEGGAPATDPSAATPAPIPAPGPAPAAPDTGATASAATSIPLFDGFDTSNYLQELDPEDAAYLELNVKNLLPSGRIEYDPASGAVRIDYSIGKDLAKDIVWVDPATKGYTRFEDPLYASGKRNQDPEQLKNIAFSIESSTRGWAAIPVPLRYYAKIEWGMQIGTMSKSGTFTAILMYDAKKKTGYAAEWIKLGLLSGGVAKVGSAPGAYNQVADQWFDKKKVVPMLVEYRTPDPKKGGDPTKSGLFSITYNVGGEPTVTNSISVAQYKGGQVAFQWSDTKFKMMELLITGILDKKAAVEMLKARDPAAKKTAAKKTEAKKPLKKAEPEKEAPKDDTAEEPKEDAKAEPKDDAKAEPKEETEDPPAAEGSGE